VDAVPLFFVLGAVARVAKSDLRIPAALYEVLSIFLLLAIGLKGGVELARSASVDILYQSAAVIALGAALPLLAFPVLRALGRLSRPDAASFAAHYGSVSAVTFAVAVTFLRDRSVPVDDHFPLFLALMEAPAIIVGVVLARAGGGRDTRWGALLHEILFGKSILLLLGGIAIGWVAGPKGVAPIEPFFFTLFKGSLCFFLLEMGLVAAGHLGDLRRAGTFLVGFGVAMPLVSSVLGAGVARLLGFDAGGVFLLATLAASASYIAAPAAMRIAVPEANPALPIATSIGITFPFNIIVGLPLYFELARWVAGAR
jgi:hypothetical protein